MGEIGDFTIHLTQTGMRRCDYWPVLCAFVLGVGAFGCAPPSGRSPQVTPGLSCMERVLAVDDSFGTVRNQACARIPLAQAIKGYTQALGSQEMTDCPETFREAFRRHIAAWTDLIQVAERYPDIRGEMHDVFHELEASPDSAIFQAGLDAVWSTWEEVEMAIP